MAAGLLKEFSKNLTFRAGKDETSSAVARGQN